MGVSVRRLEGWEPAEVHEYVYDGNGRVARVVVRREAEFTADEVALLLGSVALEREVGAHGFTIAEATDPENQFAFEAPENGVVDWAERAGKRAARVFRDKYESDDPGAMEGRFFPVRRREQ